MRFPFVFLPHKPKTESYPSPVQFFFSSQARGRRKKKEKVPSLSRARAAVSFQIKSNGGLIRNRHNRLWRMHALCINHSRPPRHERLPLQKDGGPIRLCFLLLGRVLLDPIDEFLAGAGEGNMFDPDVDSFLDEAVPYSFVDDHPDRRFRYVVDHSRFAVVDFHWHPLLDRSVRLDVYNVADPVLF